MAVATHALDVTWTANDVDDMQLDICMFRTCGRIDCFDGRCVPFRQTRPGDGWRVNVRICHAQQIIEIDAFGRRLLSSC